MQNRRKEDKSYKWIIRTCVVLILTLIITSIFNGWIENRTSVRLYAHEIKNKGDITDLKAEQNFLNKSDIRIEEEIKNLKMDIKDGFKDIKEEIRKL